MPCFEIGDKSHFRDPGIKYTSVFALSSKQFLEESSALFFHKIMQFLAVGRCDVPNRPMTPAVPLSIAALQDIQLRKVSGLALNCL